MSPITLYRAYAPVDVDEGDGLTVTGTALPYDEVSTVDDGDGPYRELFERGACSTIVSRWPARRLKVQLEHPERAGMGAWVGRGHAWHDQPEGLRVELRLDDTPDGRAAAFKIRDGQTPAMSVAFVPGTSDVVFHKEIGADVIHRRSVRAISHVALVPVGAYQSALIEAIRAAPDQSPTVASGPVVAPRRDELDAWLATMRGESTG